MGAELAVWLAAANASAADAGWAGVASALGGVTCASLQFMDARVAAAPRWALAPDGVARRFAALLSVLLGFLLIWLCLALLRCALQTRVWTTVLRLGRLCAALCW